MLTTPALPEPRLVRLSGKRQVAVPAKAFSQCFCVPPEAIDELGHVGNLEWVRWVGRVAAEHSTHVGLGLEAYQKRGVVWVVRRQEVDYLAEAYDAEQLQAYTWISAVRGATSRRVTVFTRVAEPTRALLYAETTWALIDIARRLPVRVPPDLLISYGFTAESK